jgi:pyruvate formate lyase activating enzyme
MGSPARYWHPREDGRLQCDLCPRECRLRDGQRGFCHVRQRLGDELVLTTYGRSTGFCIDPIEKKPLNHFLPGTPVLSFGTAGCNLGCRFCQNWDTSQARLVLRQCEEAAPETIARAARDAGCRSVAFTYNGPEIFAEYAIDTAQACHGVGVRTVAVSSGYIQGAAREEFFAEVDGANIDLKSMDAGFYRKLCYGDLEPVLETLLHLRRRTEVWLEITNLVIPGHNDSTEDLRHLSTWVAEELGPDVPLHFSAFHPDHRMRDVPPTPPATLRRAVDLAREAGLHFPYTGNVHDPEGDATRCPACGTVVIQRDRYRVLAWKLDEGRCCGCGTRIPGVFEAEPGDWGNRRARVRWG